MRIQSTRSFSRDYEKLPVNIKESVNKQLALLRDNPGHPSLQLKKMRGASAIWEVRITSSYRATLTIAGDTIVLRRVGPHNMLRES